MFDFNKYLMSDEKILWQDRPVPGKGSKTQNIPGSLFVIAFMLVIQILLIWSVVTKTGDGANGVDFTFLLFFAITLLFQGLVIWDMIYVFFIKSKSIADDYYCITNKRALKYESKTNKLVYGYLINYEDLQTNRVKDGYGDVYMGIIMEESDDAEDDAKKISDLLLHPDPNNMPHITFESIKDPEMVLNLINKTILELKNNTNK